MSAAAPACEYPEYLRPATPVNSRPAATSLRTEPIPIRSSGIGADTGDDLRGNEAILDFVPTPQVPGIDPAHAIALVSITVHIAEPVPWPANSVMLVAFSRMNDTLASTVICADRDPALLAAMRAAGHEPLPEQVQPGHTATGWVPFRIPRSEWVAVNLVIKRDWQKGNSMARQDALLRR